MGRFLQLLRPVADLLLPCGCCGCSTPLVAGEGPWCTSCALALGRSAQSAYCPRCGLTTGEATGIAAGCPRCMRHKILFDGFARVGEYDGRLRDLICLYKFSRRQTLDLPLGRLLATSIQTQPWACELDGLVPVPLSWRSRLEYRFSPPLELARQVAREVGLPLLPLLSCRGKRLKQVGLTHEERRRNVRGAFRVRRAARPAGGIFLLIDDVSTTGATLEETTRVLKTAGASRVYAAVLAKTNPERASALRA